MNYPDDRDFIFTIFDDTDISTLEYIRPVYDFLTEEDIKITKSVWPLAYEGDSDFKGSHTLENTKYADYITELRDCGFEIGFHGPTMVSSDRNSIIRAFQVYYDVLKTYPRVYAPHAINRENLYWGSHRFTFPIFKLLYKSISGERKDYYQGHEVESRYFWGDLSLRHLDYVRSFTYSTMNLFNVGPTLLYSNPYKPYVKNFFITGDAENVEEFNYLLRLENQAELERERGICIISTHFGKGFIKERRLNARTRYLLSEIKKRNCWLAPVSEVLDYVKSKQQSNILSSYGLILMELRWLVDFIKKRKRRKHYERTELPYLS
jgi:hypothetical protein